MKYSRDKIIHEINITSQKMEIIFKEIVNYQLISSKSYNHGKMLTIQNIDFIRMFLKYT